jgi:Uma2 family endonuclease
MFCGDEVGMNVQLPVHMDKSAFLAWAQGREGRYELAGGRVVMMVGATRAHGVMLLNLASIMRGQLDPAQWTVIADFGLDLGPDTLRYPDLMVERAGGGGGEHKTTAPVLLAEILSPTTADVDLGDKAAEYLQLPSLFAYLVFAQGEPKAWIWMRESGSFPPGPRIVAGGDKTIHVEPLKLTLPLAAVYASVPD